VGRSRNRPRVLEQVLVNLLINAAHAIAPGDVEANEVFVAMRTDDSGRAVIEIRDTGEGIKPDVMAKMFEPFFTTKKAGAGTGLGLSICHGIVKSLGGEIVVTSEAGSGTTFTILLPPAPMKGESVAKSEVAKVEARRGRILVIDDENALLRAMQRILEDEDHYVVATPSAVEALSMIERGDRFDLIISDLMMPMMTGVDFYETLLRRNPELAKSVVFVSGGATTATVATFLKSVPNLQMEKPFKAAQLREVVQLALARSERAVGIDIAGVSPRSLPTGDRR
jgi:CheY-like chemotaxis protein